MHSYYERWRNSFPCELARIYNQLRSHHSCTDISDIIAIRGHFNVLFPLPYVKLANNITIAAYNLNRSEWTEGTCLSFCSKEVKEA